MNRFRIRAAKGRQCRTWLVVAGNLFEAMSLIPEDFAVRAVEVKVGTDDQTISGKPIAG